MNTTITADKQLNPDNFGLAFTTRSGYPIKYYDDGYGPLWIYRDASGLIGIVRARTWEDAYGIVEDEFLPVVPADEVHEAYGMTAEEFHSKTHQERNESGEWPDLLEGYSYQSNATGTGIVYHDLNGEQLDPLTIELCERLELKTIVKM